jgi:hypothetical protein
MLSEEEKKEIESLAKKVDGLHKLIELKLKPQPLSELWIDVSDACRLLNVCKRTLQTYRDTGVIGYSKLSGKIYFRATEIERFLYEHYIVPIDK